MNTRKVIVRVPMLAALGIGLWQLGVNPVGAAEQKEQKKATATLSVKDLQKKHGPTPPVDSTFTGVQSQPMVGELKLPIKDVKVYQFMSKTPGGKMVPVNWAYSPGQGTYMWGTSTIQCQNGGKIEQGGFAMQVHDDGSGAYALGTRKCPVAAIYGCRFDTTGMETQCGLCAWNQNELECVSD